MSSQKPIFYFDSSVVLNYAVNDQRAVRNLSNFAHGASASVITLVECLRVLDRWRLTSEIEDAVLVNARLLCLKILGGLQLIEVDEQILHLASQSFPVAIKTLDALHLASALQLQRQTGKKVIVLTHDNKFKIAALAVDLEVNEQL